MKVFEILRPDMPALSESQIINKLRSFNWKYEYLDSTFLKNRANDELAIIENAIYKLWKQDKQKAVSLWNTHSGTSPIDKTVTPSFILRLDAQDNINKF